MASLELPTVSNATPKDKDNADYHHHATVGQDAGSPKNETNFGNDEPVETCLSKPMKKSSIGGASANMINSIVGAGIIGIPYALKQSGLMAGVMLLVLVGFLTDKSLRTIVGLASFHPLLRNHRVETYEDLAGACFGKLGSNFILVNMFIMAYGALIAYLLIIKDTVPSVLEHFLFDGGGGDYDDGYDDGHNGDTLSPNFIMILTSALIMLPLSMQRDMASLSITSLFSVSADILLVCFIAGYAPIKETVEEGGGLVQVVVNDSFNPTLFIGLGILSIAMACQHSAFIVSGSLENKTMKRWATVTGNSITLSAILCVILGVAGYLGFGQDTQGNVLNNFDADSTIANVARVLLAITMFFTYPMESFVARHVLVMLFHKGDMDGRDDPSHTGKHGYEAGGVAFLNRRQSWSLCIYVAALVPALFFRDLGPVLSITGSVGGGCISYLAPGAIYLAVNGKDFLLFVSNLLEKNNGNTRSLSSVTNADLPIAGSRVVSTNQNDGCKPIWYYLGGFPMWCKIASTGKTNMALMVDDNDTGVTPNPYQPHVPESQVNDNYVEMKNNAHEDNDLMVPTTREYCIAIFFILFGVLSLVAGVTSNIWIQLNQN